MDILSNMLERAMLKEGCFFKGGCLFSLAINFGRTMPKWATSWKPVTSLQLDQKNPRLGQEASNRPPREIIQYLFEHDKAIAVAESIAIRGFFQNEPLLAIKEGSKFVVIEGNRRLAALKALLEPGLLEGKYERSVERLQRRISDLDTIRTIPIVIAPDRKSTDRLISGRHIGTTVLPWQAENRASFILEKLAEGYDNDELRDVLGFNAGDIQDARLTRAIADMARSIELPPELKAKLDNPRAKVFSTLKRVFDSKVGRKHLHVTPDPDHGIKGETSQAEFRKGFTKLVSDIAIKHKTSRDLNTNEEIEEYFKTWDKSDLPAKKRGTFVPADIIKGRSAASKKETKPSVPRKRTKSVSDTVIPKSLVIRYGDDRLIDIRKELVKMKRKDYPNAGAVLLRVFLELATRDYLERTGEMEKISDRLKAKNVRFRFGVPSLGEYSKDLIRIAKKKLGKQQATNVEKALTYNDSAPFTISDLHNFVHTNDLPGERDIEQFWKRMEPLFRLMLEEDPEMS